MDPDIDSSTVQQESRNRTATSGHGRVPEHRIMPATLHPMHNSSPKGPIKIVDLFAGCGGFTQGFHEFRPSKRHKRPVFQSVAAVEHNIAAASTYALNFADETGTDHIHAGDIEHWFPDEGEIEAEVILGGPPCQGFSGLGKGDIDDPRNKLWREYMRIVNTIKPKIFVIENVDRFLKSPEFAALKKETEDKENGELKDYDLLAPQVLNAADYGVPQARRRAIVFGVRTDSPKLKSLVYPRKTHYNPRSPKRKSPSGAIPGLENFGAGELKPWVAVGPEIFDRTPAWALDFSLPPGRMCRPLGKAGASLPGPFLTGELNIGRRPERLSVLRYLKIPEGGNRHALRGKWDTINNSKVYLSTTSWDRHNSGSGDVMGRMHRDRPSVTIRTEFYKPEKGRYLHPTLSRPITHLEAALIQGFPENFRWCGSKLEIGRQIGNAVPVGLAEAIAGVIYEVLRKK
ncbi:DNA cytosine methyltransferase [Streptomyces sp. NBC_01615]|uniref:DNA cytosine methyltransferase n=1 Tax=Streptomyces sp. NBC_01615 TaxID=2975898 RepID=UPI0038662CE8